MAADGRGERIQRLFLEAARLPADAREPWLRSHCVDDDQLFDDVRSLLHYDNLAHDPLESGLTFGTDRLSPILRDKQELPTVPGYRIVREIGTGGQAIVYEAIQESTTQRVALKMLRWGQIASTHERERLRREVLILARLRHPGIVSIIDSGETDSGVFFIATQFVDGPSLDQLYDASTDERRSAAATASGKRGDVLRLFVKICTAVHAAHRAGVVHRDLKPANILMDSEGEPRILDFGLAQPGLHESLDTPDGIALTRSGQFMGSLPWASPEQAEGESVDIRSDVYSLGVILYQLVSGGRFPYDVSGSLREVITKIMHADPTPLDRLTHDTRQIRTAPSAKLVDPKLNAIVMKALAKSADERYQTVAEFSEAVELYVSNSRDAKSAGTVVERRSHQNLFIAIAVGLSIVACLVAILNPFSSGSRANQDSATTSRSLPIEVEWTSYDEELAKLTDADSIMKINDGWRIRSREVSFPELRSEVLVLRCFLRRYSVEPVLLRLRSRDGSEISVEVSRSSDNDADQVSLRMSGMGFLDAQSRCSSVMGSAVEVSVALSPDRVTLRYDGRVIMQVHARSKIGPWTPVLDAKSADIDCVDFQYTQLSTLPGEFTADVVAKEMPAVDYIVGHGGGALSEPLSLSSKESPFHVTVLTTDGSTGPVPAHEIAKMAQCSGLKRITLARITEPGDALEHIAKLQALTAIQIAYSELDGDCFHDLAELGQLQSLRLFMTQVRNPDLGPLQRLTALKELGIDSIQVDDADLELLADIKSLKAIAARGDAVTAQGFHSLIRLRDLFFVELPSSQVSGDGIQSLSQLSNLWMLGISGSDVGDEDIPSLSRMSSLAHLTVKDTRLSADGVERLRLALPDCAIVAGEGK